MKVAFPVSIAAAVTLVTMLVAPAQAQLKHTWVASNGLDSNNCDRPTPCATFQVAFEKTAAGGEITCADSGNFSGMNITKSITVNCQDAIGVVGTGSFSGGIVVETAATDVVILRGLDFDATGLAPAGPLGLINFRGAGVLHVDKAKVTNMRGGGNGIYFAPIGPARLDVSDTLIANNGATGVSSGMLIQPASGVTAHVRIVRSVIANNRFGIIAAGASGGTIRGLIADSFVTGSVNNGITVSTTGTNVVFAVDNTKIAGNSFGLVATGANAGMLVGRSVITTNNTGLSTSSGGVLLSYRDNRLNANTSDGAFTGPVGLQ